MPLWKLHPIDLSDPNWEMSSHRDVVVVRAADEERARDVAQQAFGVKRGFPLKGGVTAPPWKRPQLVSAELIKDSRWEDEGPDAVLMPSFAADLPPKRK